MDGGPVNGTQADEASKDETRANGNGKLDAEGGCDGSGSASSSGSLCGPRDGWRPPDCWVSTTRRWSGPRSRARSQVAWAMRWSGCYCHRTVLLNSPIRGASVIWRDAWRRWSPDWSHCRRNCVAASGKCELWLTVVRVDTAARISTKSETGSRIARRLIPGLRWRDSIHRSLPQSGAWIRRWSPRSLPLTIRRSTARLGRWWRSGESCEPPSE